MQCRKNRLFAKQNVTMKNIILGPIYILHAFIQSANIWFHAVSLTFLIT